MVTNKSAKPLWGLNSVGQEVPIRVLGVTGPHASGKTMFLASIAPGSFPGNGPRTRYYDVELSAASYRGFGMHYVDVQEEMRSMYKNAKFTPKALYEWWRSDVLKIEPGQYDVIAVDPANDLDSGLVDYVLSRHNDYGFKSADSFEKAGGIFWARVQEELKSLAADIASRCQTFAFSNHIREVFGKDGKPTGKKEPRGKKALMELAALYMWLEREPKSDGTVPEKPRCTKLLKNRLSYTGYDPETFDPIVHPYLPPAFDDCTPNKIRSYIAKPADYGKLKKDERVVERQMSEDERLLVQREIAEAQAVASENALEQMRRRQELLEMQSTSQPLQASDVSRDMVAAAASSPAVVESIADASADAVSQATTSTPAETTRPGYATPVQIESLQQLRSTLGIPDEVWKKNIAAKTGGSGSVADLTEKQAEESIANLRRLKEQKEKAQGTAA